MKIPPKSKLPNSTLLEIVCRLHVRPKVQDSIRNRDLQTYRGLLEGRGQARDQLIHERCVGSDSLSKGEKNRGSGLVGRMPEEEEEKEEVVELPLRQRRVSFRARVER